MRFDQQTISILKNFGYFNPSMLFTEGNVLRTISLSHNVLAIGEIKQNIEKRFAIYDLYKFLNTISLIDEPDIKLCDEHIEILGDGQSIIYSYSDEEVIKIPPVGEPDILDPDVSFELEYASIAKVMKAMHTLQLKHFVFEARKGNLYVEAKDLTKSTDDSFSFCLGECDKNFTAVFNVENLQLLPLNYDVIISKKGFARFKADNIRYWVTLDINHSKFDA